MIHPVRELCQKIAHVGLEHAADESEKQRLRIVNVGNCVTILLMLPYLVYFLYLQMVIPTLALIIVICLYALTFPLIHYGYTVISRVGVFAVANATIFYFNVLLGEQSHTWLIFLTLFGSPYVYFSYRYFRYANICASMPIISYTLLILLWPGKLAPILSLRGDILVFYTHSIFYISASFILGNIVMLYLQHAQAQKFLVAARDDAMKADQAKSTFLSIISHEIRTPLNGIIGSAELLLTNSDPAETKSIVKMIKKSGISLLTILNDILDISKIESGKFQLESVVFNPVSTITDTLNILRPTLGREVDLYCEIQAEALGDKGVLGDPLRFQQIIQNLATNAIKFTKKGSIVINASFTAESEKRIDMHVRVSDTGIGFDPQKADELLHPYTQAEYSTTRQYGGSGLGLSIARQLIESMDSELTVKSEPGKGTTFSFTLCFETAPLPAQIQPVAEPEYARNDFSELRILVAEDNKVNQIVVRKMLKKVDISCELVSNGAQAVEIVSEKEFDAILMDIHMPQMDGITATKKIRELSVAWSNLPIIALTADTRKSEIQKMRTAGINDIIEKPLSLTALKSTLESLLPQPVPS